MPDKLPPYTMREGDIYPLFLYIYRHDGYHTGSELLRNEDQLKTALAGKVKEAIMQGREVRITDTGDLLVFHAEHGKIVLPSREDIANWKMN